MAPFFMAAVITTLANAITKINSLYNGSSTPPSSGEEDYTVWTDLINTAVNLWENEEGVLWKELFVELADAATGDKTTVADDYSYALPSDFKFPNSAFVWTGSGTNKTAYKVIRIEDKQLYENNSENWCYFTPTTLEFNPNLTIDAGDTISYNYYKYATALSSGSSTFEMNDPMFAVFYTLSELKKEEGDTSAIAIATQKLEAMKTRNEMGAKFQDNTADNSLTEGFGI